MELLLWTSVWAIVAIVVGVVANSRGRSGLGFFVLALLLSPVLALAVLLLTRNYAEESRQWELTREATPSHRATSQAAPPPAELQLLQLERLTALWKNGALSDEEFQIQKLAVLAGGGHTSPEAPDNTRLTQARKATTQLFGMCPRCRSTIDLEATHCRNCDASKARNADWHPQAIQ